MVSTTYQAADAVMVTHVPPLFHYGHDRNCLEQCYWFLLCRFLPGLLAPDVDTYIGDLLQRIVTLSRVAKLGLSSQLWPNLTTGQL